MVWEYITKRVEVWLSNEDIEYWKVASKELDPEEIFREGTFIEELPFNLDDTGRYVRVILFGQVNVRLPTCVRDRKRVYVWTN